MSKISLFKTAKRLYFRFAALLAALFLAVASCDFPDPFFVPVTAIEGVPATGTAGMPLTLTATVRPGFANNSDIVWTVADAGTTGASVSGNVLSASANGTVLVKAKIANGKGEGKDYTQDFSIVFSGGLQIAGMTIKTQPSKLIYAHGETLDLSGLAVTLEYDDGAAEDVEYFQFTQKGITAVPAHGTALSLSTHHDTAVLIKAGDYSAATNKLTVTKAAGAAVGTPSASWDFASKTITVSAVTVPANGQSVEYALSTSDAADPATMTWAADKLTFTKADDGIADDTTYYIYARSASNENYSAGAASVSEGITTSAPVFVTGVTLNKTGATLAFGARETLTATVAPANATNKIVTWESSDTAVATVSGGMVTAVSAGTAAITVKTTDGGFTATCGVTVLTPEARIGATGYATLTEAMNAAANGTSANPTEIVILKNITATQNGANGYAYTIPEGKNIKLTVPAGQDIAITAAAGAFYLFSVSNASSSLTLGQTAGGGTLTLSGGDEASATNRRGVYVDGNGRTFVLNDGVTISGFKNSNYGRGVLVGSGTFTMNGGEISGNTGGSRGGGVYVDSGTFTMNGGTISGNPATFGGGVCVNGGTFTMNGGTISGNTATNEGGGVYSVGNFTMSGGTISGNTASTNGGGVHFDNGTFNVGKNAVVSGNQKTGDSSANNVYLSGTRVITLDTGANAPALGMEIHVQTEREDGVIVSSGATAAMTGYFVPDEAGKTVSVLSGQLIIGYPVTGVFLDKTTLELNVNQSETLTAIFTPTNATNKTVTWSSSNTAVATVDASGVVTGVSAGTAVITAKTADGGFTETCTVTVTAVFTSVTELETYLNSLPANNAANPYDISLNVSDITNIATTLRDAANKYVNLDLSGSTITSIGEGTTFYHCTSLINITIPDSVTIIGNLAFYECFSLTSVNISNNVTRIGEAAFYQCTSLTSVNIGSGVTIIERGVFSGCTSLTEINVDTGNTAFVAENGILYNKDKTTLIAYPLATGAFTFTIPNSVTTIDSLAFAYSSLASVTIPNSVTTIKDYAFFQSSLTSVSIPDSVTSIEEKAFCSFSSLITINVSGNNSAYSSQDGVLYNKDKTTLIQYPNGKTDTTFTIPNDVTRIGENAFYYCENITSVNIPESVTSIGNFAFFDCKNLTSVTFATGSYIANANFGNQVFPVGVYGSGGDSLKTAYNTGKAGTYTRAANGDTWTKEP